MTNDSTSRTAAGYFQQINSRLTRLERRLPLSLGILAGRGLQADNGTGSGIDPKTISTLSGTTAERDALFPAPTTDPERVALANSLVQWYNIDLGWQEQYYAVTGLSGLTVPGLIAGSASGWYPTGKGPYAVLYPSGSQAFSGAGNFTNWRDWGSGSSPELKSWKNTPGNTTSSIIYRATSNAAVQVFLAGRWKVTVAITYPNGTGTAVGSLRVYIPAPVNADRTRQVPVPLLSGYGQIVQLEFSNIMIPSSGYAFYRNDAGVLTIGSSVEDFLAIEYLGPPLDGLA